jgi:hypothetical protein
MSARALTIAGLLAGAAGIAAQKVAGVAMPPVPPGLVLLLVAAALMANPRWRWAAVVGVLAGLAEVAGFFGSGSAPRLLDLDELGIAASSWLRIVGVAVAVVAGVVALTARRTARPVNA